MMPEWRHQTYYDDLDSVDQLSDQYDVRFLALLWLKDDFFLETDQVRWQILMLHDKVLSESWKAWGLKVLLREVRENQ